ncbi:MAG: type 4 prepilin peptidase 1 [Alphaproteobacteria bacterium]|nr:MAG: type 4 prepilin peptidase 1 [Alphaproteobacteria bacterium]
MLDIALVLFFPFFMAFAGASDLVSMTISNKVSLALIAGFMVFAVSIGMPLSAVAWHWAMFAVVLAIGFALFALGAVGGGDAKLAASTALWLGWEHSLSYFVIAAFLGGLLTILILRVRSLPLPDRVAHVGWIARLYRADEGIPYGIALAAAAMMVYPQTPWMQHVFASAGRLG